MKQGLRSMPILPVADVQKSVDFFTEGLGFHLAGTWEHDGQVSFAIVDMDQITIGLSKSIRGGTGEEWASYFYLADIAAFADQIESNGVNILTGPKDSFYSCREVELADPDGNRLCFAQDLHPGEAGPGL